VAAIAGATLDPERLLWVPGKKLVSIPKPVREYLLELNCQLFFPRYSANGGLADDWDYYVGRFIDGVRVEVRSGLIPSPRILALGGNAAILGLDAPIADLRLPIRPMVERWERRPGCDSVWLLRSPPPIAS